MNDKEIEQLIVFCKKLLINDITKEEALKNFMSAGILDENENFTEPYYDLKNIVVEFHKI
jgi:hypothetical protein